MSQSQWSYNRHIVVNPIGISVLATASVVGTLFIRWANPEAPLGVLAISAAAHFAVGILFFRILEDIIAVSHARADAARLTKGAQELQERLDENFFTNLIRINFKYIDAYYLQTQV
jgi:hypothetical protein